jgi:hypothetical protein
MIVEERAKCPECRQTGNVFPCFITGCAGRAAVTRSWYEGPTLHACHEHQHLLPHDAPRPGVENQASLFALLTPEPEMAEATA